MNREIKFRAWDSVKNEMFIVANLALWLFNKPSRYSDGSGIPVGEFKLMQYTGLKDKNGKEIFEGDIISYGEWEHNSLNDTPEHNFVYEVKWTMLRWCLHNENYFVPMWQNMPLNNDGCVARTMEIIGNIFENPELLTK